MIEPHPVVILGINALEKEVTVIDEFNAVRGTSNLKQIRFDGVTVGPSTQNGLKRTTIFHLSPSLKFYDWDFVNKTKIGTLEDKRLREIYELFKATKAKAK